MFEAYCKLARALGSEVPRPQQPLGDRSAKGCSHEGALEGARRGAGVSLGSSQVRVGVTRGHLLEVVVQVPLDVQGDPDALQLGAEIYLETLLGPELLDEWVASVAVDRIARRSGLLVVADSRSSAPAHPLGEAGPLIRLGVEGIVGQLPGDLLQTKGQEADWIALEIPEVESGLQSERRFASTRFPEALKCALEGMPFSSSRFTRGREKFCWISWECKGSAADRLHLRSEIEAQLLESQGPGRLLFSGTGFGPRRDYLDLWVELSWIGLPRLIASFNAKVENLAFGLYDSPYSDAPLFL